MTIYETVSSINNYFNRFFHLDKHPQTDQLFLLTAFSTIIAAFGRVAKTAMLVLLGFLLLPLAIVAATAQGQEPSRVYTQPYEKFVIAQKTESIFYSKKENFLSFNLANQLAACTQSQINYGQTVFGEINTSDYLVNNRYSDEYTFSGSAGQQININLGTFDFHSALFLLDSNGIVLVSNTTSSLGPNGAAGSKQLNYTLPSAGTYEPVNNFV